LAGQKPRDMHNLVIALYGIYLGESKRALALSGNVHNQDTGEGYLDGPATFDAAITLIGNGMTLGCAMHHMGVHVELVTKLKLLPKKSRAQSCQCQLL